MTRQKHSFRPAFENLEDRSVPTAVGLYMNRGVLSINGATSGVNSIAVTGGNLNNPWVTVKGQLGSVRVNRTFGPGEVTSLQFIGGNMADTFINNTDLGSKAWGYGGNDKLFGGRANDWLYGGNGVDRLNGMNGNDYLDGGAHSDWLYGDAGNDWLIGGTGGDYMEGGADSDVLIGGSFDLPRMRYYQDKAADNMLGGAGADVFVAEWFVGTSGTRENREYFTDFSAAQGDRVDNP